MAIAIHGSRLREKPCTAGCTRESCNKGKPGENAGVLTCQTLFALCYSLTGQEKYTTAPGNYPYEKTQYINGKGTKDGKPLMAPKANATRAEVATMLYRYMTGVRVTKEEAGV